MKEIHENILTEKERQALLKFIKTKLKNFSDRHPGLQSDNNLHKYEELDIFLKKIKKYYAPYKVFSCWAFYSEGDSICWHDHHKEEKAVWSFVYYIKNEDGIGTMFKDPSIKTFDKIEYSCGKQNSLLKFPSDVIHSGPINYKKLERYVVSLDVK
tara:strand:+ start:283 stop:747 length:465 start_codon:yes stop_codon:yes gene_type:complete